MSNLGEEFTRYARAERELGEQAAPLLAAIIRAVEARAGLCITEVRVTLNRASSLNGSITANCTIVNAKNADEFPHSPTRSGDSMASDLT